MVLMQRSGSARVDVKAAIARIAAVCFLITTAMRGAMGADAAPAPTEPEPTPAAHGGHAGSDEELEVSAEPGVVGAPAEDPDPMARMEAMEPRDRWTAMVHGFAFVGYNDQGGSSGDDA